MQVRFLHDPSKDTGFVGCALSSNMVRFFKTEDESWSHEVHKKYGVQNYYFAGGRLPKPSLLESLFY